MAHPKENDRYQDKAHLPRRTLSIASLKINFMSGVHHKLVLLPGMDGTGDLFASFIKALSPDVEATVIRYSTTRIEPYPLLLGLLDAQVPASTPFVLIAESFSAPLAMQWAARNHPNLRGLVVCAGFATSPVRGWLRGLCVFLSPIFFLSLPPNVAIKHLLIDNRPSSDLVAAVRAAIGSVKRQVLSSRLRSVLTCDSRLALSATKVPVLFIQPANDRLISPRCLKEMMEILPTASVELISGPHLILQAKPRESAEIISKFVRHLL